MSEKVTISTSVECNVAEVIDALMEKRGFGTRSNAVREILDEYLRLTGAYRQPHVELPWKNIANRFERAMYYLDAGDGRAAYLWYDGDHSLYNPTFIIEEQGQEVVRRTLWVNPRGYAMYVAGSELLKRWPELEARYAPKPPTADMNCTCGEDSGLGLWSVDLEEALRAA